MTVYLSNIFLLMMYGMIFLWNKPTRNKPLFCVLATINWVFLSGFRHISVGDDTEAYKVNDFDVVLGRTWGRLIDNFATGKDPGYPILEKFVQQFTTDYQAFLVVIALLFTIPLGIWIYKNSAEPFMSFLIYSCLFSPFFAITGHRQTIATALSVLAGYKFIKERRFWPFLLLVLVASTIHKSAAIFLPFYFIANISLTKRYLAAMAVIVGTMFAFKYEVVAAVAPLVGYEVYLEQVGGASPWTFTTILLLLTMVAFWRLNVMLASNPQVKHYINALLVALALVPLVFVNPNAMRVVQYFSLFIMLLVPEILHSFSKAEKRVVYYVAATLLIVLLAKNDFQYLFFWQG